MAGTRIGINPARVTFTPSSLFAGATNEGRRKREKICCFIRGAMEIIPLSDPDTPNTLRTEETTAILRNFSRRYQLSLSASFFSLPFSHSLYAFSPSPISRRVSVSNYLSVFDTSSKSSIIIGKRYVFTSVGYFTRGSIREGASYSTTHPSYLRRKRFYELE